MVFQLDSGIKKFFGDLLSIPYSISDPANSDVIISSNNFSFRNRIKQKGSLVLPYVSFRVIPGGIKKVEVSGFPKNYAMIEDGYWDDSLYTSIQCFAFTARYEAMLWTHKFSNIMYAFQQIYLRNFKDFLVNYSYNISGTTYNFKTPLIFTNLEFDPDWVATSELDRGNLHSVDLSFEIHSYIFKNKGTYGLDGASFTSGDNVQISSPDHELTSGMSVYIDNATNNQIGGTYIVSVVDENTFTLDQTDGTAIVDGTCDWFSGVAPIDLVELDLFYNNGQFDESEDWKSIVNRYGIGDMTIEDTFIVS